MHNEHTVPKISPERLMGCGKVNGPEILIFHSWEFVHYTMKDLNLEVENFG